jgi:hypothetical protein
MSSEDWRVRIERAMAFILDQQAQAEVRWVKQDELWQHEDERWRRENERWQQQEKLRKQAWKESNERWARADERRKHDEELQKQAWEEANERWAKADERWAKVDERWALTEESVRALLAIAEIHEKEFKELRVAGKATDERLRVLINLLDQQNKKRRNGGS